ncbi:MAG: PP2C family protein-serine/threonine phosphatase [Shewanella sp.]
MNKEFLSRLLNNRYDKSVDYLIDYSVSLGSSIGNVRQSNEDRISFSKLTIRKYRKNIYVLILCDGMGGMRSGDLAASITVSSILSYLLSNYDEDDVSKSLIDAVNYSNKMVYSRLGGEGGSTLSLLLYSSLSEYYYLNVGDSRIYSAFKSAGLSQLTEDDDLKNLLAKENLSVNEDVLRRNGLTKFIGMDVDLDVKPMISETKGSVLLLSDGAHRVGQKLMAVIYSYSENISEFVHRVITLSEWMGGVDNASCIAVNFELMKPDIFEVSDESTTLTVWDSEGCYKYSSGLEFDRFNSEKVNKKRSRGSKSVDESIKGGAQKGGSDEDVISFELIPNENSGKV